MLFVTYELSRPAGSYEGFFNELQSLGAVEAVQGCWLIPASQAATDITDRLALHLDEEQDQLLVAVLNEMGEIGWINSLAGDAVLGGLIRDEREGS